MLNTAYLVSLVLFSFLAFAMGLFTILKNPKSTPSRFWFLTTMAAVAWSSSLFLNLTSEEAQQSLMYGKLLHSASAFIPIFFYHFTLEFLHKEKVNIQKIFLSVGYLAALILSYFSFFSNLVVARVDPNADFAFWIIPGSLYSIFLLYFWAYSLIAIYYLFQGYYKSDGTMKRKIFYLLVASILAIFGGGTSFLPQTLGIGPYGLLIAWVYPLLVTYGIFVEEIKLKINT